MKFFNIFLKALFNIIIIFVFLMVIIVAYSFIQINLLNKQYANFFGYTFFEVTTGSMAGTIEINDLVIVEITQNVKQGDIISFIDNNEIITHRIINEGNNKNELITKGDANNSPDKPINKTNVIGKVFKVIPEFGIWIKVFSDVKVITSIIITIALFGFSISSKKEKKAKEKVSFSRFMRNRREKRDGKSKEKEKS